MKINERIFWIAIAVILVMNKMVEMLNSFDMTINPVETCAKILVMIILTYKLINSLLPKAKAC